MESKKRNAIIMAVILILVIVIAAISVVQAISTTPPTVTALAPERTDLARTVVINGTVAAGDVFETTVSLSQKVAAVNRKAGDRVEAGDVLAELDTTDLQYQIDKTEATIAQLKASTAIAREQARLNLANAQLALSQARKNYNDARERYDEDQITALIRDQAATAYNTAENQVKLAQATYSSLDIGSESSDRKKQIDAANIDIANLRRKITESSIRSAITGTVITLDVRTGQFPTQQTALIQVADLENLKVEARVDQYDAVQLAVGQPVRILVKGIVGELDGTVAAIDDAATLQGADSATAKYRVTVTIDPAVMAAALEIRRLNAPAGPIGATDPSDPTVIAAALKPGYEVDARVVVESRSGALVLPTTVIRTADATPHVFAIRDGHAVRLDIRTGLEVDGRVEILDGIRAEDRIVAGSSRPLKDGEEVKLA